MTRRPRMSRRARPRRRPGRLALVAAPLAATAVLVMAPSAGARASAGAPAAAAVGRTAGAASTADAAGPEPGGVPLPAHGALFGAYVGVSPHTGATPQQALVNFERLIGRTVGVDRIYHGWTDAFPDATDQWAAAGGRLLMISWDTDRVPWADIAAGRDDGLIDTRAAALRRFGRPLVLIIQHEPELDKFGGTPAQYVAAFRHIHDRFVADGVTNVAFAVDLMAVTLRNGAGNQWYPGGGYVDVLGADGYNWYGCTGNPGPWTSFAAVFTAFLQWGTGLGKVLAIPEWASSEDPQHPGRKAAWIRAAAATLQQWPAVKLVTYFDNSPAHGCPPRWVDSSPSSLAAFRAMGASAYFNPGG